jgi:hypothetical protein
VPTKDHPQSATGLCVELVHIEGHDLILAVCRFYLKAVDGGLWVANLAVVPLSKSVARHLSLKRSGQKRHEQILNLFSENERALQQGKAAIPVDTNGRWEWRARAK